MAYNHTTYGLDDELDKEMMEEIVHGVMEVVGDADTHIRLTDVGTFMVTLMNSRINTVFEVDLENRDAYVNECWVPDDFRGRHLGPMAMMALLNCNKTVREVKCLAFRGAGFNGYSTWARVGFDGLIPDHTKKMMEGTRFYGMKRVQELVRADGGMEFWRKNGRSYNAALRKGE